ncbi:MAG: molybdenum ABC transporter ATP-binding protein [Acidobacteriota bacterium]
MIIGSGRSTSFAVDVDIRSDSGITVLFGPSGAGKTSILRTVAGILNPDSGRIVLGGKVFYDSLERICLPIEQRHLGYVFQDRLLFPHLTAEQNVLYGVRGGSRSKSRERIHNLLSMLGVEGTARRYPSELSGGEQQRVALARALATDPSMMLLDEPLSAVDVSTRTRLLEEISFVQRQSGIPFLYVTHNHSEAVRLGDAMYVIDNGRIVQKGSPLEIFNSPQSASVARIVGTENVFAGEIVEHKRGDGTTVVDAGSCRLEVPYKNLPLSSKVTVGIRSEDIIIAREHLTQTSARNVLRGHVRHIISEAGKAELVVACGVDFKVSITPATIRILNLEVGTEVYMLIKARSIHFLA